MKKRYYIVPNDSELRQEFNEALVVICSVRGKDGKIYDVIDYEHYHERSDIKHLLKHCKVAEIDTVDEHILP